MPKVGMKPVRKQQLIDATLESIGEYGLQSTTIITISRIAGLSSGIISHYFGGKQGLIEATIMYLLDKLRLSLLERISVKNLTADERLKIIIEANFTQFQQSTAAIKTWLSFWAESMHDPKLKRLQNINSRRLHSNLLFSFRQLLTEEKAQKAAKQTAAMIDGFWLRCALSAQPDEEFKQAEQLCKNFIDDQLNH
ncbi:transcriptional regulator BetI [Pseudocolwellia sp. HL-MZ19]|uniref:transcriptional regulator BetI n=1 Tax=unclassified Pseudocolwellia TaxID=2848178 RepID=UPI003CFAD514